MRRGRPRHDDVLTPREWEVLALLRERLTNQQIAARLGLSENTAKYHVAQILSKLGVSSRQEAAEWQPAPEPWGARFPALAFLAAPFKKLQVTTALKVGGAGAVGAATVGFLLLALGVVSMSNRQSAATPETGCPVHPDACEAARVAESWVRNDNVEAILSHMETQTFTCTEDRRPGAPYPLCEGGAAGEQREGIVLAQLSSEPVVMSKDQMRAMLQEWIDFGDGTVTDAYGSGENRLFSLGCPGVDTGGGRTCRDGFAVVFSHAGLLSNGSGQTNRGLLTFYVSSSGAAPILAPVSAVGSVTIEPDLAVALKGGAVSAGTEAANLFTSFWTGAQAEGTFFPWPGATSGLGKLVYVDDGDIWTKALPDGAPVRLTDDGEDFTPEWSPSGAWILFQKRAGNDDSRYWIMRADGQGNRSLDNAGRDYTWSPVSDTLAFVKDGSLLVEDADGGGRVEILPKPDQGLLRVVQFKWSPDGAWLVFSRQERDAAGEPFPWDYVALWRVRPDGTAAVELVNAGEAPVVGFIPVGFMPGMSGFLFAANPLISASAQSDGVELRWVGIDRGQWSPTQLQVFPQHLDYFDYAEDGSLVALITGSGRGTWQDKQLVVLESSGPAGLFARLLVPLEGSPFVQIGLLSSEGAADVSPAISPDGSRIVFASSPDLGSDFAGPLPPELNERRLWIIAGGVSQRVRLTDDSVYRDERPQWAADGRHILFARLDVENPGNASLWLLDVDDGSVSEVQDGLTMPTGAVVARGHVPWERVFDWWQP